MGEQKAGKKKLTKDQLILQAQLKLNRKNRSKIKFGKASLNESTRKNKSSVKQESAMRKALVGKLDKKIKH